MKKFSDFSSEKGLTGDKMKLESILGKEIEVKSYNVNKSKYSDGDVLKLQFNFDGKEYIVFTGSKVLIEQCEKYKEELPFVAKIEKIEKYYTFT